MYPTSSSSTLHNTRNSQLTHNASRHYDLNTRQYASSQEFHSEKIPQHSYSSSPMSSPATYPRPRPVSPSRNTYESSSPAPYSTYSPTEAGYSRSPSYTRRFSSPSTSSSSPPPVTSPLISNTFPHRDQHYSHASRVRIVGRDTSKSYMYNAQYYDDSRNLPSNDEFDSRPKLPSFQSLFGKGETSYSSPVPNSREDDLISNLFSSPMSSPALKPILPPLRSLPTMQSEAKNCTVHTSSMSQTSPESCIPALEQRSKPTVEIDRREIGNRRVRIEMMDCSNHGPRLDFDRSNPLQNVTLHPIYHTPTRRKDLFSDEGSPSPTKDTKIIFFSPSKVSPYPRRTYFLESSERERNSPEPADERGVHRVAEISGMPDIGAVKQGVLAHSPKQAEGNLPIDSATSPSSSPSVYPSSLPPSSPPTSDAQLSPLVHGKDLSVTTVSPLTDVMDLTVEFPEVDTGAQEPQKVELHGSLEPDEKISRLEEEEGSENKPANTITKTSPFPPEEDSKESTTIVIDDDEMQDALSSCRSIEPASKSVAVTLDSTGLAACSASQHTTLQTGNQPHDLVQEQDTVECLSRLTNSKEDKNKLLDTVAELAIIHDIVTVPQASTSAHQLFPQHPGSRKRKLKATSTAPSIASSAPRVTVTVVKRFKPASSIHSGDKKGTSLANGEEREPFKPERNEETKSHSSVSKIQPQPPIRNDSSSKSSLKKSKHTEEVEKVVETKPPASLDKATSALSKSSGQSQVKSSTVPAKRKASDERPSPEIPSTTTRSALNTSNHHTASSTSSAIPSKPPKRPRAVILESPVPKQPSPISDNNTWVDAGWIDALAAAYGSPHAPSRVPPKVVAAQATTERDCSSDEDQHERRLSKTKSPRSLHKRMIIESDSGESDSDIEKVVNSQQSTRTKIDTGSKKAHRTEGVKIRSPSKYKKSFVLNVSSSSESELTEPEDDEGNVDDVSEESEESGEEEGDQEGEDDEEEEEDRARKIPRNKPSNIKPGSKARTPRCTLPAASSFDLELAGIIIEAMSLSRSSSHLALSLYRTVSDTRDRVLANLMKVNTAHFDVVADKIRSEGLFEHPSAKLEQTVRKGRPKRSATANEEGGTAGMSDEDIMWVFEFERVMKEAAARCGMFGLVESSFRNDPRDRPLPFSSRFFYVPDCDPDTERAQLIRLTMPGSGKRSETKKYKQYYWKPVGK
ncbi:hypothetical protein EV360DRAFT_83505 [Lentinula raphanica]|nr:hypothetical protein EV360DRAFT_83505 [Lentinula raphanica]